MSDERQTDENDAVCDVPGCDQPAVALLSNDAPLLSSDYEERSVCRWHRSNPFGKGDGGAA